MIQYLPDYNLLTLYTHSESLNNHWNCYLRADHLRYPQIIWKEENYRNILLLSQMHRYKMAHTRTKYKKALNVLQVLAKWIPLQVGLES